MNQYILYIERFSGMILYEIRWNMKRYRFKEIINTDSFVPALTKGVKDVELIIDELNMIPINKVGVSFLDVMENKNVLGKLYYYLNNSRVSLAIKLFFLKDNLIFLNYPFLKGRIFDYIIQKRLLKNNRLCLIVHDIYSLQTDKIEKSTLEKEINIFNCADRIIFHNETMISFLINHGLKNKKCLSIDLFDYIIDDDIFEKRNLERKVIFAGNIAKAPFLSRMCFMRNRDFVLELYGPNYDKNSITAEFINYNGILDPIDIIHNLNGSFGLIWDGDSIDKCDGKFGEYLKYNNPFKLSMYIAAGIPIICWSKSATAIFVEKNNIGFCINSLEEISKIFENINEKDYERIKLNVEKIGIKVRKGFFLRQALKRLYNL